MSNPILIVEDDPDIAECLRYNLAQLQFETLVAHTGEEGLRASLDPDNPPALVLLDLRLPGPSGLEICRRLRREKRTRSMPIIMLTASASETDMTRGLQLGANAYITKPYSIKDVIARVRAVLRQVQPIDG